MNDGKESELTIMKLRMWHWRDLMCLFKLKFSKSGYSVKEFCGGCEKCNRIFGAWGVIPCPMRFYKDDNSPHDANEPTPGSTFN